MDSYRDLLGLGGRVVLPLVIAECGGVAVEVFAGGEHGADGELVAPAYGQRVLYAYVHIPVAHFKLALEQRGAAARRDGVAVVVGGAEQIGEVGADAEAAERAVAESGVKLVDAARAAARGVSVVDVVAERISHAAVGQQADARAEAAHYRKLHVDVVEAAAEGFVARGHALVVRFLAPQAGDVEPHVEKESHGVDARVAGGVHHVDGAAGMHRIAHASHLTLRGGGVVAEHAVAVARIRCHGAVLCGGAYCSGGGNCDGADQFSYFHYA